MSRAVVRVLLGGGEGTLAVPLALASAARIQERAWADFLEDPTQLANGVRDLVEAVAPDGVPVTHDEVLLEQAATRGLAAGPHAVAAVDAVGRLRQTLGDRVALVAVLPGPARISTACGLPGPAAVEAVTELGKQLLAAGVDVLIVRDAGEPVGDLATLANIARFHQALAVAYADPGGGLPTATRVPLATPAPANGVVVTEGNLDRDVDFTLLEDWVDDVH